MTSGPAERGQARIEWADGQMPVLRSIRERFSTERPLADVRVAEGTMNTCPVDPREVYAAALTTRATAIVLAHNHPSGDPEPSMQDISLTVQLAEAGRLLGIKVLDHLVLGDGNYVSLMERGLLDDEDEGKNRWGVAGGL